MYTKNSKNWLGGRQLKKYEFEFQSSQSNNQSLSD